MGYRCDGCDYDLSGLTAERCPECGQELLHGDEERRREIEAQRQSFARQWRRQAACRWIIVLAPGVFALIATAPRHGEAMLYTALWLGMAVILSFPLPTVTSSARALDEHRFRTGMWLNFAPLLHMPWVVGACLFASAWLPTPILFYTLMSFGWLAGPASLIAFAIGWIRRSRSLIAPRLGVVGHIQVIALWLVSCVGGLWLFMVATIGV